VPSAPPLNIKSARLLSNMGERTSRRTGRQTFHAGMDIGSREGEGALIRAVQGGVIEHILSDADTRRAFRGYGNGVVVDHGDGTWSLYAHMHSVIPELVPGMTVPAGTVLGLMGRTSNNTFRTMGVPHLHLELRRAKRDGSSPFPGAYRVYNLNPAEWMGARGFHFRRRGRIEIDPGSDMDASRGLWQTAPAAMLGQLGQKYGAAPSAGGGVYVGGAKSKRGVAYDWSIDSGFEPHKHDRDVWLGLPTWGWSLVALGLVGVVVAGGGVGVRRRRTAG